MGSNRELVELLVRKTGLGYTVSRRHAAIVNIMLSKVSSATLKNRSVACQELLGHRCK